MPIENPLRKTFSSLRNRNYRLYFIGQTISNTGNWLTSVALVLLVLKLTGSGFAVGVVSACNFGPVLFLSAYAGAITDRADKRKMLFITQGLEMAQSAGLAVLAFMPHPPLMGLYIIAAIGGVVLAFDNPLRRSFVSEMVPPEDLPNAIVLSNIIVNGSRVFGPMLAGLLVVTVGYGWCFAIDASTYLAVIWCIYIMDPALLNRHPPKPAAKGEVREGLRYIFSLPFLWINFIMLAFIGTLSYNFNVTMPLLVTRTLHGSAGTYTVLYSIFSLGAVVSALIVAHRVFVKMWHIIFGAAALGASMIILASAPSVAFAGAALFLVGMASIVYQTATTTMVQTQTKREMQGRLLAIQSVFMIGTAIIGGPFCGWLADKLNPRAPIIFGGIVALLAALFGYVATRRYGSGLELAEASKE